jgi:hypothetical protein
MLRLSREYLLPVALSALVLSVRLLVLSVLLMRGRHGATV